MYFSGYWDSLPDLSLSVVPLGKKRAYGFLSIGYFFQWLPPEEAVSTCSSLATLHICSKDRLEKPAFPHIHPLSCPLSHPLLYLVFYP